MRRFIVTERDLEIFNFLMESKTASRDQIHRKFFNKTGPVRTMNRRLHKLLREGYLQRSGIQIENRFVFCYSVTPRGLDTIKERIKWEILNAPQKSEKYIHDLALVDIRDKFSKFAVISIYLTENMLQSLDVDLENIDIRPFIDGNSDAAFLIKISDKEFMASLEYENTMQNSSRIYKKLKGIYASEIPIVVYICRSRGILNKMQGEERDLVRELKVIPKIYYCTIDALMESNKSIFLKNVLDESFVIK